MSNNITNKQNKEGVDAEKAMPEIAKCVKENTNLEWATRTFFLVVQRSKNDNEKLIAELEKLTSGEFQYEEATQAFEDFYAHRFRYMTEDEQRQHMRDLCGLKRA